MRGLTFTKVARAALIAASVGSLAFGPAPALAGNGPSAGDNQYVDPLSGSGPSSSHSGSSSHHSSSSATTTTTQAPSSTSGQSQSQGTGSAPSASTAVSTTARDPSHNLPYTGYELPFGAGLGAVLIGAGVVLRRRVGSFTR